VPVDAEDGHRRPIVGAVRLPVLSQEVGGLEVAGAEGAVILPAPAYDRGIAPRPARGNRWSSGF
jgi:hypothetical protein